MVGLASDDMAAIRAIVRGKNIGRRGRRKRRLELLIGGARLAKSCVFGGGGRADVWSARPHNNRVSPWSWRRAVAAASEYPVIILQPVGKLPVCALGESIRRCASDCEPVDCGWTRKSTRFHLASAAKARAQKRQCSNASRARHSAPHCVCGQRSHANATLAADSAFVFPCPIELTARRPRKSLARPVRLFAAGCERPIEASELLHFARLKFSQLGQQQQQQLEPKANAKARGQRRTRKQQRQPKR